MSTGFVTFEVRRIIRSRKFWILAFLFPGLLYLVQASIFRDFTVPGTSVGYNAYLVGSLAAFGALFVSLNVGSRVAVERTTGWQRQLRLTPLSPVSYLFAKVMVAMVIALPAILTVSLTGALVENVDLTAGRWAQLIVGVWLGTLPFALLGLLIGQLATADNVQVFVSLTHMLLGFVGGALVPTFGFPNWLHWLSVAMPSHWLAAVGHQPVLRDRQLVTAALVLAAWTIVLGLAVVARYRRDTARL
ncbi:ABC transporter permease [Micromonospora sp. WMMD1082]|uniref:ABC transporter permease n=1 Tax=Micromonospora sp. WMMD1082 TaxID=3016104 RepID=UPI002416FF27|nr:ABC transporter permease [Micromonospora sp. WMMD1082]MDG4794552.1 ABC transporter permease [Micromonospora sp. WMMD1082]